MAIQQTQSSGSSNGIMSFLFQDDGSTDGMVLEGAGFAKTLHQLLGEYEHADAQHLTPMSTELASVITDTDAELAELTAPLTAGLDKLTRDFALPEQGAALPAEAGWEGYADGQELEQACFGIAPFTDMMAALHEHSAMPEQAIEPAAAANAPEDARHTAAPAPLFSSGIQQLIELARDVQNVAATLTRASAAPVQASFIPPGRNLPASGKTLPQGFRPLTSGQAIAGMQPHTAKTVAANEALPALVPDTAANSAFVGLVADLQNAEPRAQQNASASAPAIIQGLRGESTLPNLPKAIAESTETASDMQLQSDYLAGTDAWFEDLGTRVEWLKDMNIEQADLQLHPAELGVLEIHISTVDDATTVSFVTHNADARELIEDSLPKLRELLASQGMQLGESQVSQHSEGRHQGQDLKSGSSAAPNENNTDEHTPARRVTYLADPNRIDHYV
jgi:flagellar hook-length control protein FliK